MRLSVRVLEGLPPYGPEATPFPDTWRRRGGEGFVVEFESEAGTWVGNFRPGFGGVTLATVHPNRHQAVVIANGDLWVVDPIQRSAQLTCSPVFAALEVREPAGWILSLQDFALVRFGPQGMIWRTRRLSWDGFKDLRVSSDEITGLALDLDDEWHPFRVSAATGRSWGGSYSARNEPGLERLNE